MAPAVKAWWLRVSLGASLVFCARHIMVVSAQCSLQSFTAPPFIFL